MPHQNRRTLLVILLLPAVVALALWAFVWPGARTAPHDLPVGVAGSTQSATALEERLNARHGAYDVHTYADEQAARTAIEHREVYGAFVTGAHGPEVLTATAGSPAVARLLTDAARAQAPAGTHVVTEDVVPTPSADPRGSALNSSVLPLAIAGVLAGAAVTLLGLRGLRAATALVGAAAGVGLAAAGVTDSWLGVVTGDWWAEAGVFGLVVLAGGAAVAGFAALLGPAGIALGGLVHVFLGNPFSGVTSAPELLPQPVGAIGQWLPPGAGGTLLRSVAFFDGHGAGRPLLTLGGWAAAGLLLVLLGPLIARRRPERARVVTESRSQAMSSAVLTSQQT